MKAPAGAAGRKGAPNRRPASGAVRTARGCGSSGTSFAFEAVRPRKSRSLTATHERRSSAATYPSRGPRLTEWPFPLRGRGFDGPGLYGLDLVAPGSKPRFLYESDL